MESFHRELNALTALIEVQNIPKLVQPMGESWISSRPDEKVLVVTPVGRPLCPKYKTRVSGFHLRQLVMTIKAAHQLGYCHRDVKPANMLLTVDNNLLLNDWGAAVAQDFSRPKSFPLIGTPGYCPEANIGVFTHVPSRGSDMLLVVRTAFVLVTYFQPPVLNSDTFWDSVMKEGTLWYYLLHLSSALDEDVEVDPASSSIAARLVLQGNVEEDIDSPLDIYEEVARILESMIGDSP